MCRYRLWEFARGLKARVILLTRDILFKYLSPVLHGLFSKWTHHHSCDADHLLHRRRRLRWCLFLTLFVLIMNRFLWILVGGFGISQDQGISISMDIFVTILTCIKLTALGLNNRAVGWGPFLSWLKFISTFSCQLSCLTHTNSSAASYFWLNEQIMTLITSGSLHQLLMR